MKYSIMQSVHIASDTLNYGLPVGEQGFVIQTDYHITTGLLYCVRVPSKKENWWVPECDLVASEEWLSQGIDEIVKTSITNHALETKNKALFESQNKGR